MKVMFVGCNPSLRNIDPKQPFLGTRSGAVIEGWIRLLELQPGNVGMVNLTDYATKSQSKLKKSDIDLGQFGFNLFMKSAELYVDNVTAVEMMIAKLQQAGRLDPKSLVPLSEDKLQERLAQLKTLKTPRIIALGRMAEWGIKQVGFEEYFLLPHPSGLNRKMNDRAGVDKMLADCKEWLYSLPEQSTIQGESHADGTTEEE